MESATRESEVMSTVGRVEKASAGVEDLVETLLSRLACVSTPIGDRAAAPPSQPARCYSAPLASRVDGISVRLEGVCERLAGALQRLEV